MICYPENLTDSEILALDDYWSFSELSPFEFEFSISTINQRYRPCDARPVIELIQKSAFWSDIHGLTCQDCGCKIPVKSRTGYLKCVKTKADPLCFFCTNARSERRIEQSKKTLAVFMENHFRPAAYLESLCFEECLWLLALTVEKGNGHYLLAESPEEIAVTNVRPIDQKIMQSLIQKGALVYIQNLPPEVKNANQFLYGKFERIAYDKQRREYTHHRHPASLNTGLFLRPLPPDGQNTVSEITSSLYQRLQSYKLEIDDINTVRRIVSEIQFDKIYNLAMITSRDYKIPINNTSSLSSLLNHLAKKYPPQAIYYTFSAKAKDCIVYLHKEHVSPHISKNLFVSVVAKYIQYVESNKYSLKRFSPLPIETQNSAFESLFSQIYGQNYINWDTLSADEVIYQFLDSAQLSTEAQQLLIGND